MAQQQQGVAYFNAPRVMANNNQQQEAVASAPQQAAAQQPALLPPQQYFIPNGLYPTLPVQQQQGSSVPQQQAYLIYPSIQGMPAQQVPIQYVLQQAPPVAQVAPQQVAAPQASAGIASSQLSGCCSRICQRLKKGCNARKAIAFLAIGSFVLHAVLTPLSFPWFLLVWMLMALIVGTKKINRKFAAMADDDERKGHKCFATHTLWFLVLNSFTVFLNIRCCHFPWAAYPVLIWGMFYAMHGIRRFAPHKNTAITKHAIVFVTLQLLLFITWAYAHRVPHPPRYALGANAPQPPRPAPGKGAEAPVQGYEGEQHPHHGMGGGRHHHGGRHGGKRWGGRRFGHKHGGHKQHHGPQQPAAAEAPVQAYAEGRMMNPQPQQNPQPAPAPAPAPQPPTPSSAPVTPKPGKPVQPTPQPQPPKDKKMPPPNNNSTYMPPQKPRRVFPVLLWLIPSLILTIAFVIHLKVHKRRQAAAEAQASQVEAPVQPAVAQQPAAVHEAVAPMAPEHTAV